jgi:hypothetical protein
MLPVVIATDAQVQAAHDGQLLVNYHHLPGQSPWLAGFLHTASLAKLSLKGLRATSAHAALVTRTHYTHFNKVIALDRVP